MAPKEAPCQQTHRLRLFSGERLVFESTQHISGIPMGDLFKVEARWDVTPTATSTASQPSIQVHPASPGLHCWLPGVAAGPEAAAIVRGTAGQEESAGSCALQPLVLAPSCWSWIPRAEQASPALWSAKGWALRSAAAGRPPCSHVVFPPDTHARGGASHDRALPR